MDALTKKKTDRFRFLNDLYKRTNGSKLAFVSLWDIGNELGLTREESMNASDYLKGEGLLEHVAMGGTIAITHYGVREVEAALSKPERESHYFPPVINILNVQSMVGSQIQQGTQGSSQNIVSSTTTADLREFVNLFKSKFEEMSLNPSTQAEAEAEIRTIESQLDSPKPKIGIMRESLQSLRSILEGVASNAIAAQILPPLLQILGLFAVLGG